MANVLSSENKKSVIKQVTPKIGRDGQRDTFKEFFAWNIEFENGDKGYVNSKMEDNYPYPPGTEVTYKIDTYESGWVKIGQVKRLQTNQPQTSGSSYNDPNVVAKMAMSLAIEYALKIIKIANVVPQQSQVIQTANFIYNWIVLKGYNRDVCANRWYSFQHAIELFNMGYEQPNPDKSSTENISLIANTIYSHVESTTAAGTPK